MAVVAEITLTPFNFGHLLLQMHGELRADKGRGIELHVCVWV